MQCTHCGGDTQVLDSRVHAEYARRRRLCRVCSYRFTTYEVAMEPAAWRRQSAQSERETNLASLRTPHLHVSFHTPAVLVGTAIGDALGMPFEKPDDAVHPLLATWDGNYQPGTYHQLPAGHWTDDTEMSLALAESLRDNEHYNPKDVARRYVEWLAGTPHGAGTATKEAIGRLAAGTHWAASGTTFNNENTVGSGTAMRCAPLGAYALLSDALEAACVDAQMTHAHVEAVTASLVIVTAVHQAVLLGPDQYKEPHLLLEAIMSTVNGYLGEGASLMLRLQKTARLLRERVAPLDAIEQLGRRGNVLQLVPSALYCALYYQRDFEEAVPAAVRGGGDTDTRGAITGAIVGARVGIENIPARFTQGLHRLDYLLEMDRKLFTPTKG